VINKKWIKAARRVAPDVMGRFGEICTAHAHKLLFPGFRSKLWHRH